MGDVKRGLMVFIIRWFDVGLVKRSGDVYDLLGPGFERGS